MSNNQSVKPKYRPDIDGLRAIAVLSVVIFHAFPKFLKGGFIGVDIFFVISGFLISTIIINNVNNSSFSFAEFYARRIKRILPALLLMLSVSYIFGWFALLANEFAQLSKHIAGGTAFVSNFVLLKESGYFDNDSITKPLLHLWSLGIEEQFYIIFPPIIWLTWKFRKNYFVVITILAIISFYLNLRGMKGDLTNTFYSPQTRIWELLIGSLLAEMNLKPDHYFQKQFTAFLNNFKINLIYIRNLESAAGLFLILFGIIKINQSRPFPGWLAWIPVIGAVFIIHAGMHTWLNRHVLSNKVLVWIGLISFPLYLWHWPLLSFANILQRGNDSHLITSIAVGIAIMFSAFTFYFIEKPIRYKNHPHTTPVLLFLMVVVFCQGLFTFYKNEHAHIASKIEIYNDIPLRKFQMSNLECQKKYGDLFSPDFMEKRDFCLDESPYPKNIILIGDSHAGKLYEGFLDLKIDNVLHIGRGSCPPISGLTPTEQWFNCDPTIKNIVTNAVNSEANLLIITGVFERYFDGYYQTADSKEIFKGKLEQFFKILGSSNKDVLLILDNPSLPFEPITCIKRPIELKQAGTCIFARSLHDAKINLYKDLFLKLSKDYKNIKIFDPTSLFCDDKNCYAKNSEGLLYTGDYNHLGLRGSLLVDHQIIKLFPNRFHFTSN